MNKRMIVWLLGALLLITLFPEISLWLPRLAGYEG